MVSLMGGTGPNFLLLTRGRIGGFVSSRADGRHVERTEKFLVFYAFLPNAPSYDYA